MAGNVLYQVAEVGYCVLDEKEGLISSLVQLCWTCSVACSK